ncbi:MAG: DUF4301 family protein [Thermoanaerobaculia bacterium]|nr:DUF4301 family protein [Thermoanaerobaculia bacterium]
MRDLGTRDREQLAARGITVEEAERQLLHLRHPPQPFRLDRPCSVGDGIVALTTAARAKFHERCRQAAAEGRVSKFVPASGAATRMFSVLLGLLDEQPVPTREALEGRAAAGEARALAWTRLIDRWKNFPWAPDWSGPNPDNAHPAEILDALLRDPESGLSNVPKGLVPFHQTPAGPRSAFEEHLWEGLHYLVDRHSRACYHFTVSSEHESLFAIAAERSATSIFQSSGVKIQISRSQQSPHTETLALDLRSREGSPPGKDQNHRGEPVRLEDGSLLLRPGGHGALIGNLAEFAGDLIFIKSIDNVRPESAHQEAAYWQLVLGGCALTLRDRVETWIKALQETPEREALAHAKAFLSSEFGVEVEADAAALLQALDRPLRVCGVVENTGEPGGGPFWVRHRDGRLSCQIVEAAEVPADVEQQQIFRSSSHFNPVLLACLIRDADGAPYDLEKFIDRDAVFVTRKLHLGHPLLALERPGLWNGAMAHWNTVFVEVPGSTFAPVKSVFDLLRPEHQTKT